MAASTYTTKQGDMWDSIAKKLYGDEYLMQDLIEANPDHVTTVIFSAGVVLTVPTSTTTTSSSLPPWKTSS
ncbi:hypothetical protein SPSIL_009090 [Sporomusa silvacetica DSM 10669]|uniref:Phage tail protein X n=1 Tax=Sporomusa silvacetica DSM 10669 TaxID=1123289 RepID=A0ABZ3IGP7_9FIRM|nr:tail protein X [Sporomusa silvacetica]OZC13131.1 phage tail protein X [Sporomusa silvacetica DSM 10669]